MRYLAAPCALVLAYGCGGQPVGAKVPRANPAHVGGAAAAAAALTTLADPAAAKHRQESRGGGRDQRSKKVKETVPEDVLFRQENSDAVDSASAGELPPCETTAKSKAAKKAAQGIELIPKQENPKAVAPCPEVKGETPSGEASPKAKPSESER